MKLIRVKCKDDNLGEAKKALMKIMSERIKDIAQALKDKDWETFNIRGASEQSVRQNYKNNFFSNSGDNSREIWLWQNEFKITKEQQKAIINQIVNEIKG
jgi:cytochrome c556